MKLKLPNNKLMIQLAVSFIAGMLFSQFQWFFGVTALELVKVTKVLSLVAMVCTLWIAVDFWLSRFK